MHTYSETSIGDNLEIKTTSEKRPVCCIPQTAFSMVSSFLDKSVYFRIGSIFNPLAGKFLDIPDKNLKGTKGLETGARYWLVKVKLRPIRTVQIWSKDNMAATPRLYGKSALLMDKMVMVMAGNGVTMPGYIHVVHFSGSGLSLSSSRHTQQKSGHVVSCLHDSLWRSSRERPRVVFSSRMKPNIHLMILWHEILPIKITVQYSPVGWLGLWSSTFL